MRIEGHTDTTGTAESNLILSRGPSCGGDDFLVSHGVTADRLSAKGLGARRPKVAETTADNRAEG
ncbi:hypothetical protein GCM10022225_77950 [Plantactinospora mayteni]|uniref:OmpA-like domain-containing protein n=2 Tax=Plantactinospora mayteni TaxID=566021 RepID=A0ABQ4ERE9_9ACTN|nr:hypothetical protein Pma05_38100 [Plantactinospora mayteni]